MKSNDRVFIITMAIVSIFGMLFATISYNIGDNSKIFRLKIEKGYQECVVFIPDNNHNPMIVWQKECQTTVLMQNEKEK
jgi:hypothetical protein